MSGLTPLSELIPAYPVTAPQMGAELILIDDEDIADLDLDPAAAKAVFEVRRHLRGAALSRGQSAQLGTIEEVVEALEGGDLPTIRNRWVTYPLDRYRRRDFMAVSASSSKTVTKRSVWVPELDHLPPLSEGGAYLIVRSGDPGVLEIDDVRDRLVKLAADANERYGRPGSRHPLADVVFHKRGSSTGAPTTWSLREGIGASSSEAVPFPNPDRIQEMDLWNR